MGGGGALALTLPLYELVLRLRGRAQGHWVAQLVLPLVLPILLNLFLVRQGFALGAGDTGVLAQLPLVLALMLLTALISAWSLLIELARLRPKLEAIERNAERDRGTERQIRNLVRELRAQNRRQREAENTFRLRPASAHPVANGHLIAPRRHGGHGDSNRVYRETEGAGSRRGFRRPYLIRDALISS